MKKNILFILLEQFADWEISYLSSAISMLGQNQYAIKIVSITKDNIYSIGGLQVLPDYDILSVPKDYEALILIGGMSWRTENAKKITPLVQNTLQNNKILAAICDAVGFLSTIGILNHVKHTGNDKNDLKKWAGKNYLGEENYIFKQAVKDNNIITANGTATLEFAKEVLSSLNIPEYKILEWYQFHKLGYYTTGLPDM